MGNHVRWRKHPTQSTGPVPSDDEDFVALSWRLNFEHDIYSDDFRFYHRHNRLNFSMTPRRLSTFASQRL